MRRLFAVEGAATNLPAYQDIYPNREGPIIRTAPTGERVIDRAVWGVPAPVAHAQPVTNVRNLTSQFWRSALTNPAKRWLVPVTAFAELTAEPDPTTGRERKAWFEVIDAEMYVFAGVLRRTTVGEVDRYAFLTCAPNTVVGAIHPKAMPVILHGAAIDTSLTEDAAAALALPMADELGRVIQ